MTENPRHWRLIDRPTLKVQFQFEPRDIWVGVFWRKTDIAIHVYACLLPCVPLHVSVMRRCCSEDAPAPAGEGGDRIRND